MRFGHWLYYANFDPPKDAQVIQDAFAEALLAEELGYDAVWLAERHFIGEIVYADPIIFGTALAMQTKRVQIGIAVLTMALHHPVRAAIQTALLDNLSKGRLLVGTSRGHSSTFEYSGFGTTNEAGREQINEAEDLLVKAWTTENLHYDGQYWKVAFPAVRPRPWQKPHPPLYRSCISTESVAEMGRAGRLVLLLSPSLDAVREQMAAYTDAMFSAGYDEETVQRNLDQLWMVREVYVADTTDQAMDEFLPGLEKRRKIMKELRIPWESGEQTTVSAPPGQSAEPTSGAYSSPGSNMGSFFGSPEQVKEQLAELRDMGVRNLMMTHYGQVVSTEKELNSMRLLGEKVIPAFR